MNATLHEAALAYLFAHQGEHLHADRPQLVARCTEHLHQQHDVSVDRANVVTLQALGEVESRGNAAHVDISASTSFAVFVRDPESKRNYAFTAADLLAIARQRGGRQAIH